MYVKSTLKQPSPRKEHLNFRLVTPAVVHQEYLTLLAESEHPTVDAFRRSASRLNTWIAQEPGDDRVTTPHA